MKKENQEQKDTRIPINYELERDRISLKFSVILVFLGTAAAGSLQGMFEDSFSSTAAIVFATSSDITLPLFTVSCSEITFPFLSIILCTT